MYELKRLTPDAIASAVKKAERYRLLKEPYEAESICLDVLEVDPDNQDALITLLLARTDKLGSELFPAFTQAEEALNRLSDRYCKAYYGGILAERRAKVHLEKGGPGSGQIVFEWLRKAMTAYEAAMTTCSPGNQDALLRWNTCARILNENPEIKPAEGESAVEMLDSWD